MLVYEKCECLCLVCILWQFSILRDLFVLSGQGFDK